ncbi:MAG TPA: response regulator [Flavobacteriales bacterium]|nr:response regulator [Flavobacteriales bacterium]
MTGIRTIPATVLIVEDESIVRKDIRQTIQTLGYTVVGDCADGEEAVELAVELRPDLVLMDIMLKGAMNGIDAAVMIRARTGLPVIFLTAYADDDTLSRAKIAQPYGYILKPFKAVDVHTTIEMALYKHMQDADVIKERDQLYQLATTGNANPLFLKNSGRLIRLRLEDIYYVAALKDYVGIHLKDKRYITHGTLKSIEARLPMNDFTRVHRSFIVRVDKIAAVELPNVILENDKGVIPIGESYSSKLMERLNPR